MTRLLAIDPGDVESALLVYDTETRAPRWWAKVPNAQALELISKHLDMLAVEMIASYGMPVGKTTFETCLWIGRFIERWEIQTGRPWLLVYRLDVKMHLCGNSRAKDANIRQALIDRYGPGRAAAIGRKATPGPLYGMSGDGWAALGVAVTAAETRLGGVERGAGAPESCAPTDSDWPMDRPAAASFPLSTTPREAA
jgi:hypothetical protein